MDPSTCTTLASRGFSLRSSSCREATPPTSSAPALLIRLVLRESEVREGRASPSEEGREVKELCDRLRCVRWGSDRVLGSAEREL